MIRCGCTKDGSTAFRKPKNIADIRAAFDAGVAVHDDDGDCTQGILDYDASAERVSLDVVNYGAYWVSCDEVRIEDVPLIIPATPEEEDEAVASILNAFHNKTEPSS